MRLSHKQAAVRFNGLFNKSVKSISANAVNQCRSCGRPIVRGKELCRKCSQYK